MAKGYWIVNNIVHDVESYKKYQAANAAPFAKYGAKFIVRGGTQETREGTSFPRCVVLEFDSYTDAVACYEDPEYQAAKAFRDPVAEGTLIIVEGAD